MLIKFCYSKSKNIISKINNNDDHRSEQLRQRREEEEVLVEIDDEQG
jgi:hypothetical protein